MCLSHVVAFAIEKSWAGELFQGGGVILVCGNVLVPSSDCARAVIGEEDFEDISVFGFCWEAG